MPITLNIQSVLSFAFVALIFLPLPVLILSSSLAYLKDWVVFRNYRRIIERDYAHLELVELEHLKEIFPDKKESHLENLANYLNQKRDSNSYQGR